MTALLTPTPAPRRKAASSSVASIALTAAVAVAAKPAAPAVRSAPAAPDAASAAAQVTEPSVSVMSGTFSTLTPCGHAVVSLAGVIHW